MSEQPSPGAVPPDGPQGELPALRERLLAGMLRHAPFDGWSDKALAAAARDVGVGRDLALIAFPGGPADVAAYFAADSDHRMVAAVAAVLRGEAPDATIAELPSEAAAVAGQAGGTAGDLRIRERIALVVRTRLLHMAPHREALRALAAFLALPGHAGQGARGLWRSADAMWRAIGDTATDFSYYTKRATLAGIYGATFLVWLDDASEGFADTFAFLDRRIDEVMAFEKGKARLRQQFGGLFRRARAVGPAPRVTPRARRSPTAEPKETPPSSI